MFLWKGKEAFFFLKQGSKPVMTNPGVCSLCLRKAGRLPVCSACLRGGGWFSLEPWARPPRPPYGPPRPPHSPHMPHCGLCGCLGFC